MFDIFFLIFDTCLPTSPPKEYAYTQNRNPLEKAQPEPDDIP